VVHDDDLSGERLGFLGWIVLGITTDVTTTDILDGDVLDVETNVVTWEGLWELFVMHFDGLDFSGNVDGSEGDDHGRLEDTSLDSADWDSSDTSDLVHVLKWKTEWLIGGALWWGDGIESF